MKPIIHFLSRVDFKSQISYQWNSSEYCLISISDNLSEREEMCAIIKDKAPESNHIFLAFQDVDHNDNGGISNTQARLLFQFIKDSGEDKVYIVQCFAGVSRSAAVAKFINDYYDAGSMVLENYKIYNKMVYGKLNGFCGTMSLKQYYTELENNDKGEYL